MTPEKDPLVSLVSSDTKTIDRQQLAVVLKPFIVIDEDSKEFSFLPEFSLLEGNALKISILLAGVKARALLFGLPDGLSPSDIINLEIMASGSVKSSLKRLSDDNKVKQDKEGKYFLPAYCIPDLAKKVVK